MTSATALRKRQWVSLPGGSCDVRLGTNVLDESSAIFKGAVGKPRVAALVIERGVAEEHLELLRRQLRDAGFTVAEVALPSGPSARTLSSTASLLTELEATGVTADDLMVAVGGVDVLSVASYVCAQWCNSMPLVMVPTSCAALLEAPVTPRGIDVGGREQVLSLRPAAKHVLFDFGVALDEDDREDALMARVLMVVTAMCDSEAAFSRLWDHADKICSFDHEVLCDQLQDTVKLRGKTISSTAIALRQSLSYGTSFARALQRLVGDELPASTARAEALRFQARLAAGEGMFEVDDVLAQDELLDMLELPLLHATVDPAELIEAVRNERFARSNRFLLGLPRKLGRVRLAAVSDELIAEHVAAWCASRA
ncbi:MAG: 3-dehydroquinate synthase [Atopobiaceae bacterium]|nr:3-dehydroquinate synthase [Atopobiaceae bacterium]